MQPLWEGKELPIRTAALTSTRSLGGCTPVSEMKSAHLLSTAVSWGSRSCSSSSHCRSHFTLPYSSTHSPLFCSSPRDSSRLQAARRCRPESENRAQSQWLCTCHLVASATAREHGFDRCMAGNVSPHRVSRKATNSRQRPTDTMSAAAHSTRELCSARVHITHATGALRCV